MNKDNNLLAPENIAQTLSLTVDDTKMYFCGEEVKNAAQLDEMISREHSAIELNKAAITECKEKIERLELHEAREKAENRTESGARCHAAVCAYKRMLDILEGGQDR